MGEKWWWFNAPGWMLVARYLDHNQFTGRIPDAFYKHTFLKEMYIEGNAFQPGVNPIGIHNVQHYVNGQVVIKSTRDTLESCSKAQTDSSSCFSQSFHILFTRRIVSFCSC
ncbi:uncharacterized protein LOC114288553 [Camellia sinensis]|uniref:uncharacterized protein LOC114288553 n=1 Tax=Camellia sinensis TaxID=4442 RepID=UPI00103684EF|nr:uncharacterized protein LOC114288553 [Camellia sinensis]